MEIQNIKKIHKTLTNQIKNSKGSLGLPDKLFMRHWYILYNHLRGRPLNKIESLSKTRKEVHIELLNKISKEIELPIVFEPSLFETERLIKTKLSWEVSYATNYSTYFKKIKEVKNG